MTQPIETLRFLTPDIIKAIANEHQTPVFVYDEKTLKDAAQTALAFPNKYGLTVRYAMKASPNAAILKIFSDAGLHIDASSGYEVARAIKAGVPGKNIMVTAQELAHNIKDIVEQGVMFNATSLHQIEMFGQQCPGTELSVRINPGLGSGGTKRTNVGGPASSFGIWHEHIDQIHALAETYNLTIVKVHTHIGSGSDPSVWQRISQMSIDLLNHFPKATSLNLGGGFKVGRMQDETSTDLSTVGLPVAEAFEAFKEKTGRELKLEIEPGTFLVANAASLLTSIATTTTTGDDGYLFYKLDGGMTEILRPSLYGAQHPLVVVNNADEQSTTTKTAIVSGHCCESGDIFTPAPGDPEGLAPREMTEAKPGDWLVVEGAGAYCAGMAAKNYNSFPEAAELLLRESGEICVIRKRQTLDQLLQNEIALS